MQGYKKEGIKEGINLDILRFQMKEGKTNITKNELKEILEKYFKEVPEDYTKETELEAKEEYGGENIKVSEIYDGKIIGLMPRGLEIGSEVKYEPEGTYELKEEYYNSPENESYKNVILESGEGKTFNIDTWKVLEIDEDEGKITLIASKSTHNQGGKVPLRGAQGYNNGVYLLNKACSKLYGNEEKGIKARNINIEDIEKYMKEEAISNEEGTGAHDYVDPQRGIKYLTQINTPYNKIYSKFPIIYKNEKQAVIDGKENNKNDTKFLRQSEQKSLIGKDDEGATDGYLEPEENIQPYQTYWEKNAAFMRTAFKEAENGVNYYNLIMQGTEATNYWIASRNVRITQSMGYFFCFVLFLVI